MVVGQCLLGTTPRAVNDVTDKLRRAAVLKALPKTPGATKGPVRVHRALRHRSQRRATAVAGASLRRE